MVRFNQCNFNLAASALLLPMLVKHCGCGFSRAHQEEAWHAFQTCLWEQAERILRTAAVCTVAATWLTYVIRTWALRTHVLTPHAGRTLEATHVCGGVKNGATAALWEAHAKGLICYHVWSTLHRSYTECRTTGEFLKRKEDRKNKADIRSWAMNECEAYNGVLLTM